MTNGIRPARLSTHIRSSSARVRATTRYISISSSSDRPTNPPRCVIFRSVTAIDPLDPSLAGSSEVDRASVDRHRRLAENLRQGRVRVRRRADLPWRRLELEGERCLGYEVGDMWADEVDAERVVRLGVADDLDEALVLATDERLGDRLERHPP